MKTSYGYDKMTLAKMDDDGKTPTLEQNPEGNNPHPACFGDEAKYVAYMDTIAGDADCAKCASEDECGEFILLKCSRELIF